MGRRKNSLTLGPTKKKTAGRNTRLQGLWVYHREAKSVTERSKDSKKAAFHQDVTIDRAPTHLLPGPAAAAAEKDTPTEEARAVGEFFHGGRSRKNACQAKSRPQQKQRAAAAFRAQTKAAERHGCSYAPPPALSSRFPSPPPAHTGALAHLYSR